MAATELRLEDAQVWHVKTGSRQTCHAQLLHVLVPLYFAVGRRQRKTVCSIWTPCAWSFYPCTYYIRITATMFAVSEGYKKQFSADPVGYLNGQRLWVTWIDSSFYDTKQFGDGIARKCLVKEMRLLVCLQPTSAAVLAVTCHKRSCSWNPITKLLNYCNNVSAIHLWYWLANSVQISLKARTWTWQPYQPWLLADYHMRIKWPRTRSVSAIAQSAFMEK